MKIEKKIDPRREGLNYCCWCAGKLEKQRRESRDERDIEVVSGVGGDGDDESERDVRAAQTETARSKSVVFLFLFFCLSSLIKDKAEKGKRSKKGGGGERESSQSRQIDIKVVRGAGSWELEAECERCEVRGANRGKSVAPGQDASGVQRSVEWRQNNVDYCAMAVEVWDVKGEKGQRIAGNDGLSTKYTPKLGGGIADTEVAGPSGLRPTNARSCLKGERVAGNADKGSTSEAVFEL